MISIYPELCIIESLIRMQIRRKELKKVKKKNHLMNHFLEKEG